MSEIYVDPATSQAPIIRVEGVCYQNAGPSDNEPDPSIVVDEELNTCDECTYRQASDCAMGELAGVWMTTDDAKLMKGPFIVDNGCYYFDFSQDTSGSPGGTVYTAEQAQPIDSCDDCPDCTMCGYCCISDSDYVVVKITPAAADVIPCGDEGDPHWQDFQNGYNALVGKTITMIYPYDQCIGAFVRYTAAIGDGTTPWGSTEITHIAGEGNVQGVYRSNGGTDYYEFDWGSGTLLFLSGLLCCGFSFSADVDSTGTAQFFYTLMSSNPDVIIGTVIAAGSVSGTVVTRCCAVRNEDGTIKSCGVGASCEETCNPVG